MNLIGGHLQTLLCIFTIFLPVTFYEWSFFIWSLYRKLSNSEKQYIFGVSLVLLGAWFGSIPSILDWDRQWQVFIFTVLALLFIWFILYEYCDVV